MSIRRKHRHRSSIDDFDFYQHDGNDSELQRQEHEQDEDEDEEDLLTTSRGNKRIKLDNLLNDLHLSEENVVPPTTARISIKGSDIPQLIYDTDSDNDNSDDGSNRKYVINKNIQSFQFIKELSENNGTKTNMNDLNQYFSNKLLDDYQQYIESNLKVIKWYNYRFLIVIKFQHWCLRLFNRFIRKFNNENHLKIPKFNHYDKIMKLIQEQKLAVNDYLTILNNENNIDMAKLHQKQQQRTLKRKSRVLSHHHHHDLDDNEDLKDIRYNYWDTLKFDIDVDLDTENDMEQEIDEDYDTEESKIIEIRNEPDQDQGSNLNSDMDID
ncbi:hypothetical protein DFJ63DRAFT_315241 [Scheffersomyces coipomensis]|uniref:uncharacterized protein n=1 Tax=Scheffersomyces coipomensis TaxID=1788519 RepID=UPI00315D8711